MVYPQLVGRQLSKKQREATCSDNQEKLDRLIVQYEKAKPQSQYVQTLLRAIKSLAAHPSPIQTQKQALELKNVGNHIAKIICPDADEEDQMLVNAQAKNDSEPPLSQATMTSVATNSNQSDNNANATTKAKNPRKRKQATLTSNDGGEDSIAAATAKQKAYEDAVKSATTLTLPQSGWKVLLLVDQRERRSDHVVAKCRMSGIPCEERHLPIGDMAWIARCEKHNNLEVMLGTIIERKTVDDLTSSLFGTRYLEQRLRLQHCGIPQVLLLVEGDVNTVMNCPADTLEMAMMETRIQLDFQIVQTKTLEDSVRLLKRIHRRVLQRTFPCVFDQDLYDNPQHLPTFASPTAAPRGSATAVATAATGGVRRQRRPSSLMEMLMDTPPKPSLGATRFITYQELKCKIERDREAGTRTIGHVHAAMLKQVPSISQKKAIAMAQAFPTPNALMTALEGTNSGDDAKQLLSSITVDAHATRASTIGQKSADELIVAYCTTRQGSGVVAGNNNNRTTTARARTTKQPSSASLKAPPKPAATKKQITKTSATRMAQSASSDTDDESVMMSSSSPAASLPASLPPSSVETARHPPPSTSEETLARLESLLSSTKDLLSSQDSPNVPAARLARAKDTNDKMDDCVDLTQADESADDDDDDDDNDYKVPLPPTSTHASRTVSLSQDSTISLDDQRTIRGGMGEAAACVQQPLRPYVPRQNAASYAAATLPTMDKKSTLISTYSTDVENDDADNDDDSRRGKQAATRENECEVIEID